MCDPRVLRLAAEIRDLHAQQCESADRVRELQEADDRRLMESCRARGHPRLPELQYFSTVFEQQDALQKARRDPTVKARAKRLQTAAWVVIFLVCLGAQVYPGLLGGPLWSTCGVVLLLGGTMILAQHFWLHTPLCRHLRRQLIERGVPICIECGYDLRGQTTPRCPECGQPVDVSPQLAERE
jgi:uncharacterized paraquat-inducible protein A